MMLYFIFGLGNPGSEYKHTRHNAGFMVADALAEKMNVSWESKPKFQAKVAGSPSFQVILAKPQTFMNDSGRAVASVLNFYDKERCVAKDFNKVFVCYDDLDIELGQYKIQFEKHPKIHHGVSSVVQALGSEAFWNVRIGVDTRAGDRQISSVDYVLTSFSQEEKTVLAKVLKNVVQEVHAQIVSS